MPNVWVENVHAQHEKRENLTFMSMSGSSAVPGEPVRINRVDVEAPWRWLNAGWHDMKQMPIVSLTYGAVFAIVAMGLFFGLTNGGMQSVILPLAGGFMLIGPVAAVGLYEGSRRLATGEQVSFGVVLAAGFRAPGQLALLGLALMLIYLAWVQLAFLMFMMYFGGKPFPPLEQFVPDLLFTHAGLTLLFAGTFVGAVLAAVAFTISAVSAPMLADHREMGVATAVATSVKAVLFNRAAMALWAVLIVGIMALGLVTLFVGLAVAFPLIGHATWHACREITREA
jgi:uncharacterized membrane protein